MAEFRVNQLYTGADGATPVRPEREFVCDAPCVRAVLARVAREYRADPANRFDIPDAPTPGWRACAFVVSHRRKHVATLEADRLGNLKAEVLERETYHPDDPAIRQTWGPFYETGLGAWYRADDRIVREVCLPAKSTSGIDWREVVPPGYSTLGSNRKE